MRHVLVMTSTASIGLLALFLVDFADLYFLSLLGEVEVAAAIGYAGAILFFTTSIGIGLSIAAASVVSRKIGAGDAEAARRLATNCHIYAGTAAVVLSALIWPLLPGILDVLGAGGRTHELAVGYLRIISRPCRSWRLACAHPPSCALLAMPSAPCTSRLPVDS